MDPRTNEFFRAGSESLWIIFKTGKPSSEGGWIEYSLDNNENTFFISQNGDSDVTLENRQGFEVSKALQFWDTEWHWDWNPFSKSVM